MLTSARFDPIGGEYSAGKLTTLPKNLTHYPILHVSLCARLIELSADLLSPGNMPSMHKPLSNVDNGTCKSTYSTIV
jgi:hypothetical protein